MDLVSPLDDGLAETHHAASGLPYPPPGWTFTSEWGLGHAFQHSNGLRVLIDCSMKSDDRFWVHVSLSRKNWTPSHEDLRLVKAAFLGDRYAYVVFPPESQYVNLHSHCLHLWALAENNGRVLPEFSENLAGVRSI